VIPSSIIPRGARSKCRVHSLRRGHKRAVWPWPGSWKMEKEIGSGEPNKIANFTVLDEDPYAVEPMHLKDIKLWGTIFEGNKFPIQQ
jgi:hypothetical protein